MSTPLSSESKKVYVDESTGSDTTENGSPEKPYQTAAYAIFANDQSQSLIILIRSRVENDYAEISPSGLKKARKNAEGLSKKAKKAEEQRVRQEQVKRSEAERSHKKLEDSKQVVLEDDPSLPIPVKVT